MRFVSCVPSSISSALGYATIRSQQLIILNLAVRPGHLTRGKFSRVRTIIDIGVVLDFLIGGAVFGHPWRSEFPLQQS